MKRLLFLLLIATTFVLGCTKKEEDEATARTYFYDPRVPGGSIDPNNGGLAGKVYDLTADPSQLNRITLNWKVPPIYKTMSYKVMIYKITGDGTGFVLPDPADEYSAAPLYLRTQIVGESFVDQDYADENGQIQVEVQQNETYTYWVYLNITDSQGTKWSGGQKITVTSKSPEDTFKFPNPIKFWENLMWQIGQTSMNDAINVQTLSPGTPARGQVKGSFATAYSGNVMYVADTDNNRVVIYTRGLAYSCDQFKNTDPATYLACTYQYSGYPLTAKNVIGQNSPFEKKTCSEHESTCSVRTNQSSCESVANFNSMCSWYTDSSLPNGGACTAYERCLTAPTKISVSEIDQKLFISDSGNNRVVVYNAKTTASSPNMALLPVQGHLRDAAGGGVQFSAIDGSPDMVIGKKSLRDSTLSYPIGRSSLSHPGAVAVLGHNLYIADTGHNRLVKIQNYKDENAFLCNSEQEWDNLPTDVGGGNGKCKFTGLLGQKDYFQNWTLKDGDPAYVPGDIGYDGVTCTAIPGGTQCNSPYVVSTGPDSSLRDRLIDDRMGRFFRKPVDVHFDQDGKMLVTAQEEFSVTSPLGTAQLRGRVLVWNTDPMSDIPSPDSSRCTAGWYAMGDPGNNFDSSNFCQANLVIGQEASFSRLSIVSPGGSYAGANPYNLDSTDSISLRGKSLFSVDFLNNHLHYWEDYLTASTSNGTPYTNRITNPNGALNSQTGTYLPVLLSIADIEITSTNLILVSDPLNGRIYEVRAYDYEQ